MRLSLCVVASFLIHAQQFAWAQSTSPATARESARIRVELPAGWEIKPTTVKSCVQSASYQDFAHFALFVQPKVDLADDVDLKAWAKSAEEYAAKNSPLANRKVSGLRDRDVNGRKTVEYEVTGEFKGRKFRYRNIFLQLGTQYCELQCSTIPSHWEESQEKFDELVSRLK